MPVPALQALVKKSGKTLKELEKYWDEAVKQAKKKGYGRVTDKKFYTYVMGITKIRAGIKEEVYEQYLAGIPTNLNIN